MTDNCDGSTKVQSLRGASQGKVDVKDFGKPRKKIVLNPGQSYLAKPGKENRCLHRQVLDDEPTKRQT